MYTSTVTKIFTTLRTKRDFKTNKYLFVEFMYMPGYGLDDRGSSVLFPVGAGNFSPPPRRERIWGPPSLLSNGYQGLFTRG
jgi:hypothetical protein